MSGDYHVHGQPGSPYTRKMRAILRYRRLPYRSHSGLAGQGEIAHVKPRVIPVIQFPGGRFRVDSTPMIDELEALHSERSVVPDDAAFAFLAYLVEDFADEWVTKAMFHYRWYYDFDVFPLEGSFHGSGAIGREPLEALAASFRERQLGRMARVGCTEQNKPLIEASFEDLARALDAQVSEQLFLFGSRPSRADFALQGQLTQLVNDPTPSALLREIAPVLFAWVPWVDDLSGHEGSWQASDAVLAPGTRRLLELCGELYLPFLVANAEALERGDEELALELRGRELRQAPFRYQAKCLDELRSRYGALAPVERERVDQLLEGTGCSDLLGADRAPA